MQISGAEWKQFLEDDLFWGNESLEEWKIEINGISRSAEDGSFIAEVPFDAIIEIKYGWVTNIDNEGPLFVDLSKFYKKWAKMQTNTRLVVEAPKEKIEAIKKAVKSAGGKVL